MTNFRRPHLLIVVFLNILLHMSSNGVGTEGYGLAQGDLVYPCYWPVLQEKDP